MPERRPRVGLLATHPIQYYVPWYRALARDVDLEVFFSHQQTGSGQASAGFGVAFDWDVPLLEGYRHTFLRNTARHPDVSTFWGCVTPELPRVIRDRAFDAFIVHGWSTRSYWQSMTACWRTGTPILVRGDSNLSTPRAWWWRTLKEPIFRAFISRFDGYLTVGERARRYLLHYGAREDRCFRAPHCVDNTFFAERAAALHADRTAVRDQFGLSPNDVAFLFAGKFIDVKRPDLFIEAIGRAAQQDRRVVGVMVGDGPLLESARAKAAALGVSIVFAGFLNQSEIVRAYVAADVLVLPSRSETWGLVVNEAMACGLPAIVSDTVGCADDLIVAGETGSVFPAGDVAALSGRMIDLATNADARLRQGAAARRRVARFDVRDAVRGTLDAIAAVARPAQRAASDHDGTHADRAGHAARH